MNPQPNFDEIPESLLDKSKTFQIEPAKKGYWCFFTGHRSAGDLQEVPLNETIKWIIEQISFGHFTGITDKSGDIVSIRIGKESPIPGDSEDELAKGVFIDLMGFGIAGMIAQCRESGSYAKNSALEKKIWETSNQNSQRRMEMHYAQVLAQILGHVSKKLPRLEHLPILDSAPDKTKLYIAEATRSYLFKLDNACIALCRACLEDTLNNLLTGEIQDEIHDEISSRRRKGEQAGWLFAMIEVLSRRGILGRHKKDAHDIRGAGNKTLHADLPHNAEAKLAWDILTKTRRILSFIHQKPSMPS